MSSNRKSDQTVYAAAQGREFLRNQLADKENSWIFEYAGLIDDAETLDLLNYYCGLFEDTGDNFLETRLAQIIIKSAATRTTDRAYREGNVSQLQGMVGLVGRGEDGKQALSEIAERLADEGMICFIVGPPGSGKTALMADVTRVWGALTGGQVYSNLVWEGADKTVTTDREMFEAMAHYEGPTLGALDELSQELTGRGKQASQAEKFAKALTLVRKKESKHGPYAKRGSVVGVAHTKKRLAPSLRRMATLVVQKPSRKDPGRLILYESEGGSDDLTEIGQYRGLTDTRERYNQHEASSFDVLGDVEDDGDETEAPPDPDEVRREAAIETAVKAVKPWTDEGMSYREAASLVPFSSSWVGERAKEWESGQHRDVVDAPEDESV